MNVTTLRGYLAALEAPVSYRQTQRDQGFDRLADLTRALETLMVEDAAAGRPLLAARVVSRTTALPARGFFDHARSLGYRIDDERAFHAAELAALGNTRGLA